MHRAIVDAAYLTLDRAARVCIACAPGHCNVTFTPDGGESDGGDTCDAGESRVQPAGDVLYLQNTHLFLHASLVDHAFVSRNASAPFAVADAADAPNAPPPPAEDVLACVWTAMSLFAVVAMAMVCWFDLTAEGRSKKRRWHYATARRCVTTSDACRTPYQPFPDAHKAHSRTATATATATPSQTSQTTTPPSADEVGAWHKVSYRPTSSWC